jgi:hypothetical protein
MPENTTPPQDVTSSGNEPQPETGTTPQQQGVTPEPQKQPSLSAEELQKKIAELEHSLKNKSEEAKRHYSRLSEFEKAEKERQDAQLSEIERTKKQHAELQAQHSAYQQQMQDRLVRYELEKQAHTLGIIDPDAAARLLDRSELEYDDDGVPTNAKALLEKLLKNKPYLAPAKPTQNESQQGNNQQQQPTPARAQNPTLPAMNPGRSQIAQPGQTTPGKPVRLSDIWHK